MNAPSHRFAFEGSPASEPFDRSLNAEVPKQKPSSTASPSSGGVVSMSYGKNGRTRGAKAHDEAVIDARERFISAVRSVPIKEISAPGILSENTVQAWRSGKQDPRLSKAMFAGQRAEKIQEALLDILLANNPERRAAYRQVPHLIASLAEIVASCADETARAIATRALRQFSEGAR